MRTLAAFLLIGSMLLAQDAAIGKAAPNVKLKDLSGKEASLEDYKDKVVVLTFWSATCPTSLNYEPRMQDFAKWCDKNGVTFLAVASESNETPKKIGEYVKTKSIGYTILLDSDSAVAKSYGAKLSTTTFVIDKKGVLAFRGGFDNHKKPDANGYVNYVQKACEDLLAGKDVSTSEAKTFG